MEEQRRKEIANLNRSPAWQKIMSFYTWLKPGIWAMRLPIVGQILQKTWIKEGSDANWFIPINQSISVGTQMILPRAVVEHLLSEADSIFSMSACPCRTAFKCISHPWNIGCLHLGPATRGIPEELGRLLSLDEGLDHLQRALDSGLVPTILYIPSEAEIFRVDKRRMLSICFCCECCCDVRLLLREGPNRYWDIYNHRMPEVEVIIGSECTGCGECVSACYGGDRVITINTDRAEIHERCIGCGLCIPACPEGAISLSIDPSLDIMKELVAKISGHTNIGMG